MTRHIIYIGDSKEILKILPKESINLVITSPPYHEIKDYDNKSQIGFNQSYSNYRNDLKSIWKECYRLLEGTCRLCINVGDIFLSSKEHGRYRIIPLHSDVITDCINIGFDYWGYIKWKKISTSNASGGVNANYMGSYPYPSNPVIAFNSEFILIFKKGGFPPRKINNEIKNKSKLTKEQWSEYVKDEWAIKGERQTTNHPAVFPLEIPNRLIKLYSYYGDTILDPFLGSGTSILSARRNERNSIGIELSKKYLPLIKEKTLYYQKDVLNDIKIKIIHFKNRDD